MYLSFLLFYTYTMESHKAFGSYRVGLKGIVIYYPDPVSEFQMDSYILKIRISVSVSIGAHT